jgi:hypothetical protein
MPQSDLLFHDVGDWPAPRVEARWVASSHAPPPEVLELIDTAWRAGMAKPGVKLFDGPMCRMESWAVDPDGRLRLTLSPTGYKAFWGTNLSHPELADQYGRAVLANPVGVSPALESADGYLLMGRRNDQVAYYPSRIHPFAGCLEPRDVDRRGGPDLFNAVRRELAEELNLSDADIADVRCTGVVEDVQLRQPELIFRVVARRSRAQIEEGVADEEHHGMIAVPATADGVAPLLADSLITPVGRASLLLWGRVAFGQSWFDQNARR